MNMYTVETLALYFQAYTREFKQNEEAETQFSKFKESAGRLSDSVKLKRGTLAQMQHLFHYERTLLPLGEHFAELEKGCVPLDVAPTINQLASDIKRLSQSLSESSKAILFKNTCPVDQGELKVCQQSRKRGTGHFPMSF